MAWRAIRQRVGGLWPGRITGPILSKELRTSSRRRRNYVLRATYVLLLTLFVVLVWLAAVDVGDTVSLEDLMRFPEMGKDIIETVMWFQFCAAQLLAVVLLSNAISDEVYHRTLGVLMSTPIRAGQIVVGKLLSKLLQLLLLLAISLPLLLVLRVFGGVPWGFVVGGLCITLTACIFAAAVSLLFSILLRRAYAAILVTLAAGFVLHGVLWAILWMAARALSEENAEQLIPVILHANPFAAMSYLTLQMEAPMFLGGGPSFLWPLHCGIMVAASAGVLAACVLLVRRVGLRQATGDTGVFSRPARAPVAASAAAPVAPPAGGAAAPAPPVVYAPPAPAGKIRRINGSPVLWRELRQPLTRSVVKRVLGVVIPVVLLATLYAFFAGYEMLEEVDTHVFFVCLYLIAGILVTVVLAATSITTEKETGSWPLLLATTIAARHIVLAKAAGVLRRSLPVWAFLAAHVVAFSVVGYVHPVAIFLVALVAGWTAIFLTGLGLWLSALLRRSTTAVITALGAVLVLWLLLPLLLELTSHIDFDDYEVRRTLDDAAQAVAAANPVRQAAVLMGGTAGTFQAEESLRALDFNWPDPYGYLDAGECALAVIGHAYGYGIVAVLLSAAAGRRVRRRIYPG